MGFESGPSADDAVNEKTPASSVDGEKRKGIMARLLGRGEKSVEEQGQLDHEMMDELDALLGENILLGEGAQECLVKGECIAPDIFDEDKGPFQEEYRAASKRTSEEWGLRVEAINGISDEEQVKRAVRVKKLITRVNEAEGEDVLLLTREGILTYPEYALSLIQKDDEIPRKKPVDTPYLAQVDEIVRRIDRQGSYIYEMKKDMMGEDFLEELADETVRFRIDHIDQKKGGGSSFSERVSYGLYADKQGNRIQALLSELYPDFSIDQRHSRNESKIYVGILLSKMDQRSPTSLIMAVLEHFPRMDQSQYDLLIGFLTQSVEPVHFGFNVLELELKPEQAMAIGDQIMRNGTELERYYLNLKHPSLYEALMKENEYELKADYLTTLGEDHVLLEDTDLPMGKPVHVMVHPLFKLSWEGSIPEQIRAVLESDGVGAARDAFQEMQHIKGIMERGESVIFILPRHSEDRLNQLSHCLNDLMGGYPNFFFMESAVSTKGDLATYAQEALSSSLQGHELVYSGGNLSECLWEAQYVMKQNGIEGSLDQRATSLGAEGHRKSPIRAEDLPDPSEEALASFFERHPGTKEHDVIKREQQLLHEERMSE